MRLYLVRHAETDSNKEGRAMGQREDPPLNEGWVQQVVQLL
ncbi:MAG TPA: histidine phosphatase family protein, partial [Candidatus Paceibacterota bacterium]